MNPLAWNSEIFQRMRPSRSVALGVLPIGLMVISGALFFYLATYLLQNFGVPPGAPIADQPNALLWQVVGLAAMAIFMVCGYFVGWALNAAALYFLFRWPRERVSRVLLHSDVPTSWLTAPSATIAPAAGSSMLNSPWAVTRTKGKWHFVFRRGVVGWGVPMYFLIAVLPIMRGRENFSAADLLLKASIWGIAGAAFGLTIWHLSENRFLKQRDKQKP